MNGDGLATILEGAARMADFKSLIYAKNSINALAIDRLELVLTKPVPVHLEELSFIDCNISPTIVEQLMYLLQTKSRLKKFTLVHV